MHVKAMDRHQISLSLSFTLYLISGVRGLHFYPEFIDPISVEPRNTDALGSPSVSVLHSGLQVGCRTCPAFMWMLEIQSRVLKFAQHMLDPCSHLPRSWKQRYQSLISNTLMFQFIGILITLRILSLNIGICNCVHVVKLFFLDNLWS